MNRPQIVNATLEDLGEEAKLVELYIDVLESELSTLKAQREWVSVEERLPEKDGFYVVACRHKIGVPHLVCLNPFKVETGLFSEHNAVTHWQPLPPAPEGE